MAADTASSKTFTLKLSNHYMEYFRMYAFVYRHLLERLGRDRTEALWRASDASTEDALFDRLLKTDWEPESEASGDPRSDRKALLDRLFTPAVQGVSPAEAAVFLLGVVPFRQFESRFPGLRFQRESTTYEALHLLVHGLACFAETALAQIGQAAQFMIYDALMEEISDRLTPTTMGRDWIKAIYVRSRERPAASSPPPQKPQLTMGSAGHIEQVVRVAEDEVIVHMTQCSWADYYLDRHPGVGQLLGCCVDDPVYRRTADGLRLQREFTLMDGGPYCDFRFYHASQIGPVS